MSTPVIQDLIESRFAAQLRPKLGRSLLITRIELGFARRKEAVSDFGLGRFTTELSPQLVGRLGHLLAGVSPEVPELSPDFGQASDATPETSDPEHGPDAIAGERASPTASAVPKRRTVTG